MSATSKNPARPTPTPPPAAGPATDPEAPQRRATPVVEEDLPGSCGPPLYRCVPPEPATTATTGK